MLKLAPSILSADFSRLGEEIRAIETAGAHYVHIDVMDGHFVPNLTLGAPVVERLRPVSELVFDVHLMVEKPERYVEAFAKAGADILTVHVEAAEDMDGLLEQIGSLGMKRGASIKPGTDVDVLLPYMDRLELALVMSVEPGFGGQAFLPEALEKARKLRRYVEENRLSTEIEMDGGIYRNNLQPVLEAGVNVVVAGSAVFGQGDPGGAVADFYRAFADFAGEGTA